MFEEDAYTDNEEKGTREACREMEIKARNDSGSRAEADSGEKSKKKAERSGKGKDPGSTPGS